MKTDSWWFKFYINFFGRNVWALAHFVIAILVSSIVWRFTPHTLDTVWLGFRLVLIIAFLWEVVELVFEIILQKKTVIEVYGSVKHYLQDTAGDIICAIIGFGIALI